MFRGRDRIAERRVHDHDTAAGRGRNIDIVDTDAGASNDLQTVRLIEQFFGDFGCRANGQPIISADNTEQFFLVFAHFREEIHIDAAIAKYLYGGVRKSIGNQNARCHDVLRDVWVICSVKAENRPK